MKPSPGQKGRKVER